MKVLFTFENCLPSREADAEVFTTTAAYLAARLERSWLHVPVARAAGGGEAGGGAAGGGAAPGRLVAVRARAPAAPAILRHVCCGLTIAATEAFREADLVYTRNLYQIPPLQPLLRALMRHRRFLLNICHSEFTRDSYLSIGLPADRQVCIRNGFEPDRLRALPAVAIAKQLVGVPAGRRTVVYTGRVNGRKGLDLLVDAAARLPDVLFLLVGSAGDGPVEALAKGRANIRLIPWQAPDRLADYLAAADVLVIPPSTRPLAEFGTTVLPLKLFLYMASGRPILAGATPDVSEVLRHRHNAFLCRPDDPQALADGLAELLGDPSLASRLAAAALAESADLTWDARARRIVDAIEARRHASPARLDRSRPLPLGPWLGRSGAWLVHVLRNRSIVLPPRRQPRADRPPRA